MEFFVQQAVLDAGVKILFPVIRGMDNTVESDEWKIYRTQKLHELYEQYAELDVHADPVLEGFNILHDETGVKRRKNIPASENLIKLLKKGQGEMSTSTRRWTSTTCCRWRASWRWAPTTSTRWTAT